MKAESEEIRKKSKKGKFKNKDQEKGEKRSIEDDEEIVKQKKRIKKQKKAKEKKNGNSIEKIEESEPVQSTEESLKEDNEDEEDKGKKKGPSKRQLKKERAELRIAEAKEANKQGTAQKALNYISKWKHAKSEWKFNKVTQIWLIQNLLDDNYVPDEHFPTILEYFEGSKGLARTKLIDKAMAVVKKAEDKIEEDEEIVKTPEYKRARQLLQALPTET